MQHHRPRRGDADGRGIDTSAYLPMDPDLVAPAVGWLAHEDCSITGEMLVSMAGRVARAFIGESRGVYRPDWTIESIGAEMEAIRDVGDPLVFGLEGHVEHIRYSFGMAIRG